MIAQVEVQYPSGIGVLAKQVVLKERHSGHLNNYVWTNLHWFHWVLCDRELLDHYSQQPIIYDYNDLLMMIALIFLPGAAPTEGFCWTSSRGGDHHHQQHHDISIFSIFSIINISINHQHQSSASTSTSNIRITISTLNIFLFFKQVGRRGSSRALHLYKQPFPQVPTFLNGYCHDCLLPTFFKWILSWLLVGVGWGPWLDCL